MYRRYLHHSGLGGNQDFCLGFAPNCSMINPAALAASLHTILRHTSTQMSVFANLATHVNVYTPSTALPFFRALVPINPMSATCGCPQELGQPVQ